MLAPRSYQSEAIEAIGAAWAKGITRPALVLPTGAGKTVVFSWIAHYWHAAIEALPESRPHRVVILVHRDELVQQAVAKLHDVAPHLSVGVVKAARNEVGAQVIVASVQTLARGTKRLDQLRDVGLVIVDECHHVVAESYLHTLRHLGVMGGSTLALGVTATMSRSDGKALGHVWQEIVYEKDILWMIRHGYLADIRGYGITAEDLDLSSVRTRMGDFADADLGRALENSSALELAAAKWNEHAPGKPGIAFTPTVDTAHLAAEAFNAAGLYAVAVDGGMHTDRRREAVGAFLDGQIQVLMNCALFTEGTDLPRAEVCALLRPTKSEGLYIQMAGRVLRPYPGKEHATLLDLAGNAGRHNLRTFGDLSGIELYEHESLLEAADREDLEALAELEDLAASGIQLGPEPGLIVLEESESRELDLFGGSRQQWARTHAGWWFLATGEHFVAIVPGALPTTWNVNWYGQRSGGAPIAAGVSSQEAAMAHGEQWAASFGAHISSRKAAWRSRPATDAQLRKAAGHGLTPPAGATQGEVGDLINREIASSRIDRLIRDWLTARGRTS